MSAAVSPYWIEFAESGIPMAFPAEYDYDAVLACAKASVEHGIAGEDQLIFRRNEHNGESVRVATVSCRDGSVEEVPNA